MYKVTYWNRRQEFYFETKPSKDELNHFAYHRLGGDGKNDWKLFTLTKIRVIDNKKRQGGG